MSRPARAVAFAPASVANVAVGFDVLGHSVPALGDRVTAARLDERIVRIASVSGVAAAELPLEASRNTAAVAVAALMDALHLQWGFELEIEKGIPLASGLGGSAASAVAAVVAANALLPKPADMLSLLKCAMRGEAAASGALHIDNVAPSLYGGLVLVVGIDNPVVARIPVPDVVRCVLVHPHMEVATRAARQMLNATVSLADVVWQHANLAGFVAGCFMGDLGLIRASLEDVVIEPQRKVLIPNFDHIKQAAMAMGALGCSISGAGPSVFAWCEASRAEDVRGAIVRMFESTGLVTDSWITPVGGPGARIVGQE